MNDVEGWVKVHRKLIKSRVFRNEGLLKVWLWCLLKANHKGKWVAITTGRGKTEVWVDAGQFIFGRYKAALELSMNPSTVWKRIGKLKVLSQITLKSGTHYTVITIVNWNSYQGVFQKSDNQVTTKGQPSNTNKNDKNDKEETTMSLQNKKDGIPHDQILDLYHAILPELPKVRVFNKQRKAMLGARWQEDTKRQKLDWWKGYFEYVHKSNFLMGDVTNFKANLGWLITKSKLRNVIEGNYH